ncbi:hypothetical protein ACIBG8_14675 [Nonomuraea sp. NPDC050556]
MTNTPSWTPTGDEASLAKDSGQTLVEVGWTNSPPIAPVLP